MRSAIGLLGRTALQCRQRGQRTVLHCPHEGQDHSKWFASCSPLGTAEEAKEKDEEEAEAEEESPEWIFLGEFLCRCILEL
jgi:hypothetical protein